MKFEKIEGKIDLLEDYYSNFRDRLEDGSSYPLVLLLLKQRPGAVVMHVEDKSEKILNEFAEEFKISTLKSEGRKSKSKAEEKFYPNDKAIFLARNEKHFETLSQSETRFYGFSDKSVGEFLGFPEEAIQYFMESESPGYETFREIENLREEIEGIELISLTTYIPAPNRESIVKAIETGRKRKKVLEKMDEKFKTDLGSRIIKNRLEQGYY